MDEAENLAKFEARAINFHRDKTRQTIIAQSLMASFRAESLEEIRLILGPIGMLTEEEIKKYEIDLEFFNIAYPVVISLQNRVIKNNIRSYPNGASQKIEIISIAWCFENNINNYNKYIKPWYEGNESYWGPQISPPAREYRNNPILKFYIKSRFLTPHGYSVLEGSFTRWAYPQVLTHRTKLTRMLDPDIYRELMRFSQENKYEDTLDQRK